MPACIRLPLPLLLIAVASLASAQTISLTERIQTKGVLKATNPGVLTITDEKGDDLVCKIQGKDQKGIPLSGAQVVLRYPAKVVIQGELSLADIKPGALVRFATQVNRLGRTNGKVTSVTVFDEKAYPLGVEVTQAAESSAGYANCIVSAEVFSYQPRTRRMMVSIPPNEFTKKSRLTFTLAPDVKLNLESDDYRRAQRGDKVPMLLAFRTSTGEILIKELTVKLTAKEIPAEANGDRGNLPSAGKYGNLSDAPKPPRDVRSPRFLLHTDLSDRSARILLDKLETMVALVSQYYNTQPKGVIECFVVRDLDNWKGQLPAQAVAKISEPAGVTLSVSAGRSTKSIVYACDDHGVVQHEAIHAYCAQTFGGTGPTWYAEGMAEMGQYWKKGQLAVAIDPVVIDYLKNAQPKKLLDIVAAGQITGDSWRAYSWRWALCHLLASNPNYSARFKGLGMAMMAGGNASFEAVYGPVAKEVSFEYDQFVRHLDNGYRADLCAWQWNRRFAPLRNKSNTKVEVLAKRGWQATSVRLTEGESYDAAAQGEWKTAQDASCGADGGPDGTGKLVAVLMNDFQLGKPFALGTRSSFVAPQSGDLYVRCQDAWNRIEDNDGSLTLYLRKTPKDD